MKLTLKTILFACVLVLLGQPVYGVDSITDSAKQEATKYIIKEFIKQQLKDTVLITSYSVNKDSPGGISQIPSFLLKNTNGSGFEAQRIGSTNQKLAAEYSWKLNKTLLTGTVTNYGLYDNDNMLSMKAICEIPIQKPFVLRYGGELQTVGFDINETRILPKIGSDYYYSDSYISADISSEYLSRINSNGLTLAHHHAVNEFKFMEGLYMNDMGSKSVFLGVQYYNVFVSISHCIQYENSTFTRDCITAGYIWKF